MRELHVDWTALHGAFQMPMPEVHCFLSLLDGNVLKLPPGDPVLATVQTNREDYVPIEAIPSRIQYQWVDEFAKSIEDETLRGRVEAAINGKGAFRRFKDILLTIPEERRRWFEFRDERLRQRIVEWIREKGISPLSSPPWETETEESSTLTNNPRDVEALRDLLIEWFDNAPEKPLEPIALERLATKIAERFSLRPLR